MKNPTLLAAISLLTLSAGCEVPELDVPESAAPIAEPSQKSTPEQAAAVSPDATSSEPREVTGRDPKKGKLSREEGGYLGSVLGAGMYAKHQIIFDQVKHAINIDYGLNEDFPKSHEEFMERVIKFNKIQLPELDEGDEYLYDPADHTLKIYRPAAADSPDQQDAK
ncbi:MAG: hypothetical protein MK171_11225 [Pirellulales bacterium]|nr:hypothetical protein [Pirellulales bacterium]